MPSVLLRENTWAGPWLGPSNPRAGPRKRRAGSYIARVSWASPCHGLGRAVSFWICDGLDRAAAHHMKNRLGRPHPEDCASSLRTWQLIPGTIVDNK